MILKREALPVRLHVRGVHTDYVTVSEDSQPMHSGVSQNVGCTRLFFPSSLPPLRSALITLSLSLLQHYCTNQLRRGWMLDDMNHVNMRRGGGGSRSARTHSHAVILYPSLYDASSHPLTYTLTYRAVHTQTPCGGFGNPSSDPNVSSQSRTKAPTTIVCCWILRGAFPSCQFVQVGIKKTSWPT